MATSRTWVATVAGDGMLAGNFSDGVAPGVQAVSTLTNSAGAISDGETVTIGATYRFKTILAAAFDVKLAPAGEPIETLANFVKAINLTGTPGIEYHVDTIIHPDVSAVVGEGITSDITAKKYGTAANSIATTETMANGSWTAGVMAGGTQWDDEDEFILNISSHVAMTTNIDWSSAAFDPPLLLGKVTKHKNNFSMIGSISVPLKFRLYDSTRKVIVRGVGDVFIENDSLFAGTKLVVDGAVNVTVTDGGAGQGFGEIYVKSGFCDVYGDMWRGLGIATTVGTNAHLILRAGRDAPRYVIAMQGLIENERIMYAHSVGNLADRAGIVISAGTGRVLQTGSSEAAVDGILNLGMGQLEFKPVSVGGSVVPYLLSGHTDFSDSLLDITIAFGGAIGPRAKFIESPVVSSIDFGVDLRKEYP